LETLNTSENSRIQVFIITQQGNTINRKWIDLDEIISNVKDHTQEVTGNIDKEPDIMQKEAGSI